MDSNVQGRKARKITKATTVNSNVYLLKKKKRKKKIQVLRAL